MFQVTIDKKVINILIVVCCLAKRLECVKLASALPEPK